MARRTAQFLFALLPAVASAFSNTHPIVAWSSHSSTALNAASSSKSLHPATIFESIFLDDDICEHDAIILVEHEGLHASDLRTLSPSSSLAQTLNFASSTLELPYARRSTSRPFSSLAGSVAARCGAQVVSHVPGQSTAGLPSGKKHVVYVEVPAIGTVKGAERKSVVSEQESWLSSSLESLMDAFPKHLVVYAGWGPSLHARQSFSFSSVANSTSASAFAAPSGGILARYQLLTPGLILSLLVGLFVLLPTVMMGVSAVASIKSPLQGEAPKGFIAAEKKNQ